MQKKSHRSTGAWIWAVTFKDRFLNALKHLFAASPALWLVYLWLTDDLGFEPVREATLHTGFTALVFLLLSLACRPAGLIVANQTGRDELYPANIIYPLVGEFSRSRRLLGLYAFFYATLHMLLFFVVDYELDPGFISEAVLEKPYALAGLLAYIILLILALTSGKEAKRQLGGNWKRLHRLVYVAGASAVIHFVWMVKTDYREPALYGGIFLVLMALRIRYYLNLK